MFFVLFSHIFDFSLILYIIFFPLFFYFRLFSRSLYSLRPRFLSHRLLLFPIAMDNAYDRGQPINLRHQPSDYKTLTFYRSLIYFQNPQPPSEYWDEARFKGRSVLCESTHSMEMLMILVISKLSPW